MRPYEELCRIDSLTDLKLIKAFLDSHNIEYFVQGDPVNLLLFHVKDYMRVMVKYDELPRAKEVLARAY